MRWLALVALLGGVLVGSLCGLRTGANDTLDSFTTQFPIKDGPVGVAVTGAEEAPTIQSIAVYGD